MATKHTSATVKFEAGEVVGQHFRAVLTYDRGCKARTIWHLAMMCQAAASLLSTSPAHSKIASKQAELHYKLAMVTRLPLVLQAPTNHPQYSCAALCHGTDEPSLRRTKAGLLANKGPK